MRGSVKSRRDGREHGKDIDDRHWAIESDDDSGRPGSYAANSGHQDQDSFAASPVRQRRGQGATTADGTIRSSPTSPTAVAPPSR